jgi:hypothetical protein
VSAEPDARWDGRRWVSADGLWAWDGSRWLRFGSNLRAGTRVALYGGIGLGLSLPIIFVLALFWGLQGPGWDYSPPDVVGSIVQVALTLGGAFITLVASWFLTRVDRRDWGLGAVVAWPWIVIGGILAYDFFLAQPLEVAPGCGCNPRLDGALVIGLPLLFVVLSLTGSIVGSRRLPSARPGDTQIRGYAAVSADPPQPSLLETTVEDATNAEATNTHRNGKSASWWRAFADSIYLLTPNNNFFGCGGSLILISILAAILYWILG